MLHIGRIEKIIVNDEKNKYFTATISWLDMPGGFYNEASISAQVKLSYTYISRSFGFQYYPVPGDVVVCDFLEDGHPIVLSYLASDFYSKVIDNNNYGYYFRKLVQGEFALKGLTGNELYLDRKGSLKFVSRDQNIFTDVLKTYQKNETQNISDSKTKSAAIKRIELESANYITKLSSGVDLTRQVADYTKTEVTIGQVYDDKYETEEKLNGESLAVKVVGYTNNAETDDKGKLNVTTEQTYSLKINTQGELALSRADGKYNISIDKEGNISLLGTNITLSANNIMVGTNSPEPAVKGQTLQQWCNTHTHSNGNNGSPTGPAIKQLPAETLSKSVKVQ